MLFELIHGTGLRLQEAYTLRRDQVDLGRWVLQVEGSKGHRGKVKPRVVPIIPGLRDLLSRHCEGRDWLLFPSLWDGTVEGRRKAKSRLVSRFATLFAYAQVPDFVEHDLRHSACCMWFEMRNAQGAWAFSEVEIARLMGWSNLSMVLRYASFRAEDLAARLTV
jgi:integrase